MKINTLSCDQSVNNRLSCVTRGLNSVGNFFLTPARYLTSGYSATCVYKDKQRNISELKQDQASWLKTLGACLAVLPGIIFGGIARGAALAISHRLRKHYRDLTKESNADPKMNAIQKKIKQQHELTDKDIYPNNFENCPANTFIVTPLPKEHTSTCRRIDKLGANEKWIPHQLLANANNKKVYLFEVYHEKVIHLFLSKNENLRYVDFSASLKKILEKNCTIKQRIATCYYANAYLHLELPQSSVISMGSTPWENENCLIPVGMDHHQLLCQDNEEHIIIDPTWPRCEFYQSVVLVASNQKDLNEMYEIAFGRRYQMQKPFLEDKERLHTFLNISSS